MMRTQIPIRRFLSVVVLVLSHAVSTTSFAQNVTLNGHSGSVMMAAFAVEDGRVVTASGDQTAKLWDAVTGTELKTFSQHTGPLYCLAVSADGRTLVTGAQDNTLRVWDLPLSHPVRRVTAPGAAVTDFSVSPDASRLLVGAVDHSVRLISLAVNSAPNEAPPMAIPRAGHASEVFATAYRNDGNSFASADATGHIFVWSPDLDQPIATLAGQQGRVTAIVLPNNDQRLATAGDDGIIRVWQLPAPAPKNLVTSDVAGDTIAMLPGQQVAVYALVNGQTRLMNLQTGEVQREFPQPTGETTQIAISPTSGWFARANTAGRSELINVADASVIGSVAGHDGAINDMIICQDGVRFATAGTDGTVRLWKQPVGAVPMPGHSGALRGLVVARSGTWSLTISEDMITRRWNTAGALVSQYANHTQPLRAVTISHDDTLFATGDSEGTVWVWNAANGTAQGVVAAHAAAVTALEFSADRSSLITASTDGTIRNWTLPLPAQKPADGAEPIKPTWEFKTTDGTGIQQLARLSLEHGLAALTTAGTAIVRLRWDGTVGDPIASPGGVLKRLDVAADGSAFLSTSDAGQVHIFEINGALRKTLPQIGGLTSARFDRNAAFVAVCKAQPFVQRMQIESGRVDEEITTAFPVTDAAFIAEDQRSLVCTGAGNDSVLVQSALLKLWSDIKGGTVSLTISPDQQFVFGGGADGVIRQWNLADANPANIEPVKLFGGHTASVNGLSVSANGQLLCSASDDKTLRIWRTADASIVHTIEHPKAVGSLSISPDATRIVTGCDDGVVRV
ncbi:MAG: WD40 repeat domain-containing protein, partial [Planctomycetota bacterium]|nr:WD40 repeat domain-containing protein [Planctomycetota bacterium]